MKNTTFLISLFTTISKFLFILGFLSVLVVSVTDVPDCLHCKNGCDNTIGYCNGTCEDGFFGDDCNSTCPVNCYSRCNRETGSCAFCKDTFYGLNCSIACPAGCMNDHCNQTGHCYGCNYGYFGGHCDKKCPSNCRKVCGQDTGTCDFGCDDGFWDKNCDKNCSNRCDGTCKQFSGDCWSCKPGFGGINCEVDCMKNCDSCNTNDSCYKCLPGWYGDICDKKCPQNCKDSICSVFDGSCTCAKGWFGETCEGKCIDNCDSCYDNSTCITCSAGYSGRLCDQGCPENCTSCFRDGAKCTGCTPNSFGVDVNCRCSLDECSKKENSKCSECKQPGWFIRYGGCCRCSDHCKGGISNCDNSTGVCLDGCEPGYFGDKCLEKCSEHCAGNGTVCNATTGECPSGCEQDWYESTCKYGCSLETPHCAKCVSFKDNYNKFESSYCSVCSDGYYRSFDVETCRVCDTCFNNKCNGSNGLCLQGCKPGWFMNPFWNGICDHKCSVGCVDGECDTNNGTCLRGCNPGYSGPKCDLSCGDKCLNRTCAQFSQTCLACVPGKYGKYCYLSCGYCVEGICNQTTGECERGCKHGSYGPTCWSSCSNCLGGDCNQDGSCQMGCVHGFYGPYCNNSCPSNCQLCHPVSGQCIDQYKVCNGSNLCNFTDTSCLPGKFGFRCEHPCSRGCRNVSSNGLNSETAVTSSELNSEYICEKYTGVCVNSCNSGYYGARCDKSCGNCSLHGKNQPSCDPDTGVCRTCLKTFHGDRCLQQCNKTCVDSDCRKDGVCSKGCVTGWQGLFCEVYLLPQKRSRKMSTGTISGISVGAVVFVLIIISSVYFVCKRRNRDGDHFKMTTY